MNPNRWSEWRQLLLAAHGRGIARIVWPTLTLALAVYAPPSVAAPTFEERVARARAAEGNPVFKPYLTAMEASIGRYVENGVQNCLIKVREPDLSQFILVADVNQKGEPTRIDVKPHNKMSDCFAGAFSLVPMPKLAPYTKAEELPILLDIKLK